MLDAGRSLHKSSGPTPLLNYGHVEQFSQQYSDILDLIVPFNPLLLSSSTQLGAK